MKTKPYRQTYHIEFDDRQWDEIEALTFEPFEIERGEALTRGQWNAIADMLVGKSVLMREGRYDCDWDDGVDCRAWADELRAIADVILTKFTPGDGQI